MLSAIKSQLKAIDGKPFKYVYSALSLASVLDKPITQSPALYIISIADRPGKEQRTTGQLLQKVDVSFGVVIALRSVNNPTGEAANDELEQYRKHIKDALFGWQPTSEHIPILLGSGDLVSMNKNGIWWLDKFTTSIYVEAKHGQ